MRTYEQLMQNFWDSTGQNEEARWAWLTAAHIVGQHVYALHWRNHVAMLGFSLRQRDYGEAAVQIFRLVLVPLGHLLDKLPAGNPGRATVSAFLPMAPDGITKQRIAKARQQSA